MHTNLFVGVIGEEIEIFRLYRGKLQMSTTRLDVASDPLAVSEKLRSLFEGMYSCRMAYYGFVSGSSCAYEGFSIEYKTLGKFYHYVCIIRTK